MKTIKRPHMLNEERVSLWNAAIAVLLCLIIAVTMLNFRFVWDVYGVEVSGGSMENTLKSGDFLYADASATPQRGDIIIIDVTKYRDRFYFHGENLVKRLIGLEGDVIRITEGKVYRRLAGESEFVLLEEDYTKGETYAEGDPFEATVGEGEIFFLGDHRTNSTDSRMVGCLKVTDVVGVVAPWSVEHKQATKWEAFFRWAKDLL